MIASDYSKGIAIVGMAGRFPGANNIAQFWDLLRLGKEGITFFTDDDLLKAGVDPAVLSLPNYVRAAGILDDYDGFDAPFFGIGPAEARIMDPQQRLFLECAWEALEDAGYDPHKTRERIGVFAGANMSSYLLSNLHLGTDLASLASNVEVFTGNDKDYLATRVSYKLDLKGPSLNVNTACSTSLVAVALGCMHLSDWYCDLALAGGVSVQVPHISGYLYQDLNGGLSPDGHCRPFDARANGCVFGSGVAIVVLKRLEDALTNGDHIHAVIRGWAINNDGSRKAGFMAPSVEGHAEVIAEAQVMAGFDPDTISMVEAHGTGTKLGDPIEVAALTNAFRASTSRKAFCTLGSVKSNIGHLVSAAGVTGLIKTTLALEHNLIPPTVHFSQPNEQLVLQESPFRVSSEAEQWPHRDTPRRAGVSSLGVGGTNVHVCLEEAPLRLPVVDESLPQLLILSSRSRHSLDRMTARLSARLRDQPPLQLVDVAYTLRVGRREFLERRCLVATKSEDAAEILSSDDRAGVYSGTAPSGDLPVMFLFSGAGAFAPVAIRDIYNAEITFRESFDHCASILEDHLGMDFRTMLLKSDSASSDEISRSAAFGLPLLFALQYSLAQLWMRWGIRPEGMLGYSSGEYAVACLAGVFSVEDGIRLIAARGRLLDALPSGAMTAVQLPPSQLREYLTPALSISGFNTPSVSVVSGSLDEIAGLENKLRKARVPTLRVPISGAAHSPLVEPALRQFEEIVSRVPLHPPRVPYVSTVTGDWITGEQATDPRFWVRHMRETVQFVGAINRFLDRDGVFLEIGPSDSLALMSRKQLDKKKHQAAFSSLRNPPGSFAPYAFLITTLGRLWTFGVKVEWEKFDSVQKRRVPLPTYPFEHQRYWVQPTASTHQSCVTDQSAAVSQWLNAQRWKRTAPVPVAQVSGTRWLLFGGDTGLAAKTSARLIERGCEVVLVTPGAKPLNRLSARHFSLQPDEHSQYEALFTTLAEENILPDAILHFWTLSDSIPPLEGIPSVEANFFRVVNLLRTARGRSSEKGTFLGLISSHMADVDGSGDTIRPEKAILLAPCLVSSREYVHLRSRAIDLSIPSPGSYGESSIADMVIDEITNDDDEQLVALRGDSRWIRSYELCRQLNGACNGEGTLRKGGVYLITGGLGHIGMHLAEHLARKAHATLILCGRSPFPPRADWPSVASSNDPLATTAAKAARLLKIEEMGGRVEVHQVDVADRQAMMEIAEAVRGRYGPIHGIFHLAGSIVREAFCLMEEASPEHLRTNFQAKVDGLIALQDVMADSGCHFCVLFSSLAAVFGGLGNCMYAAASQYLDAFACAQSLRGPGRWISVNWDLWDIPRHENRAHIVSLESLFTQGESMSPEGALGVLDTILVQRQTPQVLVSTGDLSRRIDEFCQTNRARGKRGRQKTARNLQNEYVAPRTELEVTVAAIWESVLGCDAVGIHDNFFELGGESLLALRCAQRIREGLGVELPLRELIENPTVAAVAESIRVVRLGQPSPAQPRSLLVKLREATDNCAPTVSLVCVPYSGGNAIMYKPMADALPSHYTVYAVDIPGTDYGKSGILEPGILAHRCADELSLLRPNEVEVYGHCGGVVTAMEIALLLEERGARVRALIAGAVLPFSADAAADRKNVDSLGGLSDADLAHYLQRLGALEEITDPVALKFVVDSFRSDARSIFQYYERVCAAGSVRRLTAPIFCIVGDKDPLVTGYRKRVKHWKRFSDSVYLAVLPAGGHYFVRHQPVETARLISQRKGYREQ
jgi:phthiocerol/phenolphthiocerol synthesis type-I polyketide synthase E